MQTFNKLTGIFCLGQDPEVKYTPSGVAVASFSGASEHSYKTKDGDWEKITEWTNFTAWNKQAESIGEYLRKGSTVHVEGRMQTDKWEDKDGNTRYTPKCVIQKIIYLTNWGNEDGNRAPKNEDRNLSSQKPRNNAPVDDDIPF